MFRNYPYHALVLLGWKTPTSSLAVQFRKTRARGRQGGDTAQLTIPMPSYTNTDAANGTVILESLQ